MAGTTEGGRQAAKTTKDKHGKDFHKKIGSIGGHKGTGGGFTNDPERAKWTGRLGGRPPAGETSLARKQRVLEARQALAELNKQRGMV